MLPLPNPTNAINQIRFLILDFDGVCYPAELMRACKKDITVILADLYHRHSGGRMSKNCAQRIAERALHHHSDIVSLYLHFAKLHGFKDLRKIRQKIMDDFHSIGYQCFVSRHKPSTLHNPELAAEMRACRDLGFSFGMATNGMINSWASPVSRHIGIRHFFDRATMFDLPKAKYLGKSQSAHMVQRCAARMGADRQLKDCAFFDDNLHNLRVAKSAYPHLTTIYIGDKRNLTEENKKICDFTFPTLQDALKYIREVSPSASSYASAVAP